MNTFITSSFLRLSKNDLLKGLIVAVITVPVDSLYQYLTVASPINWHMVATTSLAAGISYLIKNFFTPQTIVTPSAS